MNRCLNGSLLQHPHNSLSSTVLSSPHLSQIIRRIEQTTLIINVKHSIRNIVEERAHKKNNHIETPKIERVKTFNKIQIALLPPLDCLHYYSPSPTNKDSKKVIRIPLNLWKTAHSSAMSVAKVMSVSRTMTRSRLEGRVLVRTNFISP